MQSASATLIVFTTFVYISGMIATVYGKCYGRWAIHACYGGNGKRSGPPIDSTLSDRQNDKQYVLSKLLLSEQIPDLRNELADENTSNDRVLDNSENIDQEIDAIHRRKQLKQVQSLLGALLLDARLRDSRNDVAYRR